MNDAKPKSALFWYFKRFKEVTVSPVSEATYVCSAEAKPQVDLSSLVIDIGFLTHSLMA